MSSSASVAFAPDVDPSRPAAKRRFFVPEYDFAYWRASIGNDLASALSVDASNVDQSQAIRVGSLDPGSVSFGWCVVEFAPLRETSLLGRDLASQDKWLRVPRASSSKNCV